MLSVPHGCQTVPAHTCMRCVFIAWLQGRSGITQIEGFPCEDFSTRFAGEIKGFDPTGYIDKKNARRMDSCIKYTMVAGKKVCSIFQTPVRL